MSATDFVGLVLLISYISGTYFLAFLLSPIVIVQHILGI
jgi:hypothetical protein